MLTNEELELLGNISVCDYIKHVMDYFKSGEATDTEWKAMAVAVSEASESDCAYIVESIDHRVCERVNNGARKNG